MDWPPYRALDLEEARLLPPDWSRDIEALAAEPRLIEVLSGDGDDRWTFAIREGDAVRDRLPWLWALYHGPLRAFAAARSRRPLFAANRLSASITLNVFSGRGAALDWHPDANPVSGVFFATTSEDGGALAFRGEDGHECQVFPRAGTFLCFPGGVQHRVTPTRSSMPRLSFVMLYYESVADQPFANVADRYEAP